MDCATTVALLEKTDRVLLVDNDRGTVDTFAIALRTDAFDVTTAATGRDALHAARQAPDANVCDLHLPDMSGLAVIAAFRHRGIAAPCIVITGFASTASTLEAGRLGVTSYLEKPATVGNPFCPTDNGNCFVNQEGNNYFMTLSAEISPYPGCGFPTPGTLTLHYNWPFDVSSAPRPFNGEPERLRYDRSREDLFISTLFFYTANFQRHSALPYACFPEDLPVSGYYNSNSFIRGLLQEALPLGRLPNRPVPLLTFPGSSPTSYPGWMSPVPSSQFH